MNLDFQPNPGELGSFKNLWTNAYNGQKAFFVNSSVILYACGSSIRFYNIDTKEIKSFTPPHITADHSNGFCLLTANSAINKFAFSETHLSQPKVFIFDYPSRHEVSKLTDGATIEYLAIEFSNSEVILTLSGIPELEIIVWNWKYGEKIASIDLDTTLMQPEYIKFSPVNWRSLAVAYSSEIKFYTFDPFDKENVKIKASRVAMSPINSEKEPKILPDFSEEFVYPTNAITDLDDESGEIIDEILDKREKHVFKAFCWTSADELLVVSKLNYIFKYRLNDSSMVCIYRPDLADDNGLDKRFQIDSSYEINNLYFHRQAVFASCSDGIVRLLDGSQLIHRKSSVHSDIHVKKIIETSAQFISNVNFNLRHNLLTISTDKGVYVIDSERFLPGIDETAGVLNLNQIQKQSLVVDYDYGTTIAICSLANSKAQCYLVLKETGCLQMWHTKQGQIINRLHLNEECSNMACHPKYPLAVIGTKSGRIIFLDLTDEHVPRIIEKCCIHRKQIKLFKFNLSGTLLFSVGDDNKMFIIDVRLNNKVEKFITSIDQRLVTDYIKTSNYENGFYILGYTEFDGEAVSLDVLDYLDESGESAKEKAIISRVALAVHDKSAWEIVRKNIQEIMPSIISPSSPSISDTVSSKSTSSSNSTNISAVNSSIAQNILFQNAQMDLVINRSTYSYNEKDVNYDQKSTKQTVKLACKLMVFDFNFNIFSDKVKIYASKRLDLKDDVLMKSVFYSHFLFSSIILASRSHVVCSTDRFISKFTLPEYDGTKKASKITYLELNEIVGVHDLGYSYLTKSINNKFIAIGGYDGCVSIRKSSDLKAFIDTKISHFTNGGIELVEFNHDGSSLFILNHDNTLINLNWV